MHRSTVAIFGITIDNLSMQQTVDRILLLIEEYSKNKTPQYIATANLDFLNNIHGWQPGTIKSPSLLAALRKSALVTADGMPIVWLSKLMGTPLHDRIAGADLIPEILNAFNQRKMRVFLLGGREKSAKQSAEKFQKAYPNLVIAGVSSPKISLSYEDQNDQQIIDQINQSQPDLLLIALGNPKQELWFEKIKGKLKVPLSIGVGGVFEFISGNIKRAPKWMQQMGLEWVFRLWQEPRRLWKRYLVDSSKFIYMSLPLLFYYYVNMPLARLFAKESASLKIDKPGVLTLPQTLNEKAVMDLQKSFEKFLDHDKIIIDFHHVTDIDPAGLGWLINAWLEAESKLKNISAIGISPTIRRYLVLQRCWDIFKN